MNDYELFGLIGIILLIILIPTIAIFVCLIYLANYLNLSGIVWWSFIIVGYIFIGAVLGCLNRIRSS